MRYQTLNILPPMSGGPKPVFISYAREDAKEAQRIHADLTERGIDCWLDVEDLLPGQRWRLAIQNAISGCDYFLALLSMNSVEKRGFVQAELKEALRVLEELPDDQVFVIPIRLDDCKISNPSLTELNWINLFESYEAGIANITRAIELGQKSEMAVTNLTMGGRRPQQTQWEESDFVGTVWHQEIKDGNPTEVFIKFEEDGGFLFKYKADEEFHVTDRESHWMLSPSLLTINWNAGFNVDAFPLFEHTTDVLHGTQRVGNCLIVFRRISE